jgi:hypothetical protein
MIDNQKERRWREADCVFKHWAKASHSSQWTASADGEHAKAVKHQGREIEQRAGEAHHANQKFSDNRAYLVRFAPTESPPRACSPLSRMPQVAVEVLQNDTDLNLGPRSRSRIKLKNLEVQGYRNADARMKNTLHGLMAVHSVILDVESVVCEEPKRFRSTMLTCVQVERGILTTKFNRESKTTILTGSSQKGPSQTCCIPGSYHLTITVARGVEKTFLIHNLGI